MVGLEETAARATTGDDAEDPPHWAGRSADVPRPPAAQDRRFTGRSRPAEMGADTVHRAADLERTVRPISGGHAALTVCTDGTPRPRTVTITGSRGGSAPCSSL